MKRDNIFVQFGLYLVVGGSSTVVDLGGFALLRALSVPVIVASPTSFVSGTIFNYFASYIVAFRRGRYGRTHEIGRLFAVALVGLILNSFFVWLFIAAAGLHPMWAKTLAVPCVLMWNFLARRWLVFHPELPSGTWQMSQNLMEHFDKSGTGAPPAGSAPTER